MEGRKNYCNAKRGGGALLGAGIAVVGLGFYLVHFFSAQAQGIPNANPECFMPPQAGMDPLCNQTAAALIRICAAVCDKDAQYLTATSASLIIPAVVGGLAIVFGGLKLMKTSNNNASSADSETPLMSP